MHHETSYLTSVLVMFKVYIVILASFLSTHGDSVIGKTRSSVLANIHTTPYNMNQLDALFTFNLFQ